jgi:hypothetical protein
MLLTTPVNGSCSLVKQHMAVRSWQLLASSKFTMWDGHDSCLNERALLATAGIWPALVYLENYWHRQNSQCGMAMIAAWRKEHLPRLEYDRRWFIWKSQQDLLGNPAPNTYGDGVHHPVMITRCKTRSNGFVLGSLGGTTIILCTWWWALGDSSSHLLGDLAPEIYRSDDWNEWCSSLFD